MYRNEIAETPLRASAGLNLPALTRQVPEKNTIMKNTMQKTNTGNGFSAHVDIVDLEELGWDFTELYEGVAAAHGLSLEEAETWEKENYHIRLYNNGNGVMWIPSHNTAGDTGDAEGPGDEDQTEIDIQQLYADGLLWEVTEGE